MDISEQYELLGNRSNLCQQRNLISLKIVSISSSTLLLTISSKNMKIGLIGIPILLSRISNKLSSKYKYMETVNIP